MNPSASLRPHRPPARFFIAAAACFLATLAPAQSGSGLTLPGGYDSVVYATGFFSSPLTALTLDAQNRVFVSTIDGHIYILVDANQDGVAESATLFYANAGWHLQSVTDILWIGTKLFVCHLGSVQNLGMVTTLEDTNGDDVADVVTDIVTNIPTGFHQNNGLLQDGPNHILITNGSATDIGPETSPLNAAVLRCELTGANLSVYASGLRNTFRLARHPVTGDLYGGDNEWNVHPSHPLVGDELNRIVAGADYGYPAFFGDPPTGSPVTGPVMLLAQHVAPTGLEFNPNTAISGYQNEIFMTLFTQGASATLARIPIFYGPVSGQPKAFAELFASGFVNPIDVEFLPDGSMLVADFSAMKVHRIFPKSDATLTVGAPPIIGTTCPVRIKSASNPGAVVYMGASLAPLPAVVLGPNLSVYLDLASPVFTISITPGNPYFNFPVPGYLDASGEYVASIAIPNLPILVGLEVWVSFVALDGSLAPLATSPAQSVKILPVW